MDTFDRVREARPESASDLSAARAALESEMAGHRPRRRRVAGATLAAAGVLTVGGVVTAFVVGGEPAAVEAPRIAGTAEAAPKMELASAVLNRAAELQLKTADVALQPGQYLRTSIDMEQMVGLRTGWETSEDPFQESGGEVVAVVRSSSVETQYRPADPAADVIGEETPFHGIEALGDTAAAEAAWNGYYVPNGKPAIGGPAPAVTVENLGPAPSVGEYSRDPQAFFDAQLQRTREFVELTGLERNEEKLPELTGIRMWGKLTREEFHSEPAEYRATFLKALALAPGTRIIGTSGEFSVLEYDSDVELTYRVSIDNATGEVRKVEERYDSRANPDGTRPAFFGDRFDVTYVITQQVVDSAPAQR